MLHVISIWANHLLTYFSLPHTDVCFWTIVLITDSISSQNRQINTFWHWFWLLFTYYISKLQNLFTITTLLKDLKLLILDYIIILFALLRPCLNQVIVEIVITPMILSDCNWTRTHNHLVHKRTLSSHEHSQFG